MVGWGWWGATKWQGKHTLCSYTCIMDPLVLELAHKVMIAIKVTEFEKIYSYSFNLYLAVGTPCVLCLQSSAQTLIMTAYTLHWHKVPMCKHCKYSVYEV